MKGRPAWRQPPYIAESEAYEPAPPPPFSPTSTV
jgi:hypothetical protein